MTVAHDHPKSAGAPFEACDPATLLSIARRSARLGDAEQAVDALRAIVDSASGFRTWAAAAKLLERLPAASLRTKRTLGVAVLGTYTTQQFGPLLKLAGLRFGLRLEVYDGPYGQIDQQVLDPASELYEAPRDYVVFAVHDGAFGFPLVVDDPTSLVHVERDRWTTLWSAVTERSGAKVVHHLPALPPDEPLGHLATRLPGSRRSVLRSLNAALGMAAGDDVVVVDCERLSAQVGSRIWFNARYWHLSKQAVGLDALPTLAQSTAAVMAADAGLSKRCLVLDLDNTLWGGVIGEDGLEGIKVGGDAEGEAYQRFQEYLRELTTRGIVLAVVSKNVDADARLPFERHPEMRLRLEDFAAFVANWDPKTSNIERLADQLGLGLDSMVFVDDNPVEREAVRRGLPDVEVLPLPADPALFVEAVADFPLLEPARLTREDRNRTAQYRARAAIDRERASAPNLESFLSSLEMTAVVTPFAEVNLPRIAQLLAKTNQFNATTRRHNVETLRAMMSDPRWMGYSLQLSDRLVDHGLVAVAIVAEIDDALDIDTFLMSCRVMGRTVETTLLARLAAEAARRECKQLRGTLIPSSRNQPVLDVYERHGFALVSKDPAGTTVWNYDLSVSGFITNDLIAVRT